MGLVVVEREAPFASPPRPALFLFTTPLSFARQFGVAWWLYIDGTASTDDSFTKDAAAYTWLPGVGMSLAFLMLNMLPWESLNADDAAYHGGNVALKARCWLVFAMLVAMGSLSGAIKIFVSDYANRDGCDGNCKYAGVALFVQCILIFIRCGPKPRNTGQGWGVTAPHPARAACAAESGGGSGSGNPWALQEPALRVVAWVWAPFRSAQKHPFRRPPSVCLFL